MIRRRSLDRKRKKISTGHKRSRKRKSSYKFGKNESSIFGKLSNFVSSKKLLRLLVYVKDFLSGTLSNIKPDESIKLTWIEKIQRFIINLYKTRIISFVKKLTPVQVLLLLEGKYKDSLRKKLLFNIDQSSIDENQITGLKENAKLLFLKSIFGKTVIHSIKKFIESLTSDQLVLLINGKFDLMNAMYNSFLHTKYPTLKSVKEELPKIKAEVAEETSTND